MSQLILAGVPLGNVGDASERLRQALSIATHIAAEDSRKLTRLCQDLGIEHHAKVTSFFEGNEDEKVDHLIEIIESGHDLLVVTDAGMPTVSDPGFRLVRECVRRKISVSVLPGPSAVITALALSGLPSDRFTFEGFVPRTSGARDTFYLGLLHEPRTIVAFEAPHRLCDSLDSAHRHLGDKRAIVICREMTKTYEEVFRGNLSEALHWSQSKPILGEITLVIAGFDPAELEYSEDEVINAVLEQESLGHPRKAAISEVAQRFDIPKRLVFDAMVRHKRETE